MKKSLYYMFVGPELHDAISHVINGNQKAYREVEKLCREKPDLLKDYYGNSTPLHDCLTFKQDALTVLLLRYSADPNDEYRSEACKGKPLQEYINRKDLSMIQLLAIYGANEENIIFPQAKEEQAVYQAYLKGKQIFEMKQELKSKINQSANHMGLIDEDLMETIKDHCEALQAVFKSIETEEPNRIFQNHYKEEAERFRQLPEQLMEQRTKLKKTPGYSLFKACSPKYQSSFYEELMLHTTPLLMDTQQANAPMKKYQ